MTQSGFNLNQSLFEPKVHGSIDFPFNCYQNVFTKKNINFISHHWHPEMEIVYVESGKIIYSINDKNIELSAGQALLVASNQLHAADYSTDAVYYALVFNPSIIYQTTSSVLYEMYFKQATFKSMLLNDDEAKIAASIVNICNNNVNNYQLKVISKLYELFCSILEHSDLNILSTSSYSSLRLKKILDYIYHNYQHKIKIDDLCNEVNLCRSEVCKLFKNFIGSTFTEFLTKFRIEKSVELLMSDQTNITELADMVGFNSSSYFTETFKKYFNDTPLSYKKKHLNNNGGKLC